MSENTEKKEKRMHPVLWFGGALLFAVGAVHFGLNVVKGLDAKKWTETKCQVMRFDHTYSRKGNHHLAVAFHYTVSGKQYTSDSYAIAGNTTRDRDVFQQYRAGQEAVCYVNPANPAEAVLQRDIEFMNWLYPVFALGLAAGMVFGGVNENKRRRDEKAAAQALPLDIPAPSDQDSETRRAA